MEKTEYEKGYEAGYHNGAKDCQKLYSKILDYICSMLRIYSRSTKYDFGGVPGEVELAFGRANHYKLYYSGVNMSLDKWKEISLNASAEEVCKKIGISYRRE